MSKKAGMWAGGTDPETAPFRVYPDGTRYVKPTITMADLQGEGGRILHHGTVLNGDLLNQIYMTDSNIGRELIWVAQKGYIDDWAIYCHWSDKGLTYALEQGDKVTDKDNIRVLVDVSDEVLRHYRR